MPPGKPEDYSFQMADHGEWAPFGLFHGPQGPFYNARITSKSHGRGTVASNIRDGHLPEGTRERLLAEIEATPLPEETAKLVYTVKKCDCESGFAHAHIFDQYGTKNGPAFLGQKELTATIDHNIELGSIPDTDRDRLYAEIEASGLPEEPDLKSIIKQAMERSGLTNASVVFTDTGIMVFGDGSEPLPLEDGDYTFRRCEKNLDWVHGYLYTPSGKQMTTAIDSAEIGRQAVEDGVEKGYIPDSQRERLLAEIDTVFAAESANSR